LDTFSVHPVDCPAVTEEGAQDTVVVVAAGPPPPTLIDPVKA
jgi:hypothetical protein